MLQVIRQSTFIEGRWRNGMGTSWEIAALREEGAADFSWRLAKARIDADVPFSIYPGMDRVFMQIEGQGLDLEFANGQILHVHESFVPHSFSCDIPLNCKLLHGPCMDLNLFTARGRVKAESEIVNLAGETKIHTRGSAMVMFALEGGCELNSSNLEAGDACIAASEDFVVSRASRAKLYVGRLFVL